jgi:hypothetical protein
VKKPYGAKDLKMLTQHIVRTKLDVIAAEILQQPGIYYELYSRLFSQRIQTWMQSVSRAEAILIEKVAELDPDFCPHFERVEFEYADMPAARAHSSMPFNPAWDMQY